MTQRIAIVTDSTCDLLVEWREKYEINVIPLTIIFGEEQLLDGVDISAQAFYDRLEAEDVHPTTSQPTPKDFTEIFQQLKNNGTEEIVCVLISSAMSGTFASAQQAGEGFSIPVHIHDSRASA